MRHLYLLLPLLLLVTPRTATAQPIVYLVRHAEKVDDSPNARLSDAGHARARKLARMLRDVKVTHVFVTDRERTQQTVAPLLEQSKATRVVVPAKESTAQVPQKLQALGSSDVAVVVNHSNLIPALWKALGCTPDITLGEQEYDRLLVVLPAKDGAPVCLQLRMD
ncbi:phosphoglycerate mutase family protein [Archangium sp.]|uniref:SixA phosphatase family protein n=1 Tax=Archangium sp. TaxID=1872627 RepID=UPI002D6BA98A|nr:phosphoglycerate mutase family protein [Archangium sp.]HYO54991.1 phosphoglycerate mutase family protein [Archangium sp.]